MKPRAGGASTQPFSPPWRAWASEGRFHDPDATGFAQSGPSPFSADAGFRELRLTLGAMVPVSEHWLVGVGVMFMRLVGDAADSPIVDDRGSANQISGGLGVAYAW